MAMLKITQEQQRFEILQIEQHIAHFNDLDIIEIEKQKILRLIYFAKKALGRYTKVPISEGENALNDSGKI